MPDPKTTPPRPPPVSFREVSGRQKALVNTVIEKCDVIKVRFAKELDDSKASIESKTVENVSRVASSLRSGVGIVLKVATASARLSPRTAHAPSLTWIARGTCSNTCVRARAAGGCFITDPSPYPTRVSQGCAVESFVPGVPASRVLRKGDVIVAIDGEEVSDVNIASVLTGSDTPGSTVTISYKQPDSGDSKDVILTRLPAESFSDRKNLLELLRQMKGSARTRQDDAGALLVDKAVDLWQKMCISEEDVRTQVTEESVSLVEAAHDMMAEMGDAVEKLHSMYDLERFITEQEFLQKRVPQLEDEIQRLAPEKEHLAQEVNAKKAALHGLNQELDAAKTEVGAHTRCSSPRPLLTHCTHK